MRLLWLFIASLLIILSGCSKYKAFHKSLDPTVISTYPHEKDKYAYPVELIFTKEFISYESIADVGSRTDYVSLGRYLVASSENLIKILFEDVTVVSDTSQSGNSLIVIKPHVTVVRNKAKFIWDDITTTTNLTWVLSDKDGKELFKVFATGTGIGKKGNSTNLEPFKDSMEDVFLNSYVLLSKSYLLNETDLCASFYSCNEKKQSELANSILASTQHESEKKQKGLVMLCYAARKNNYSLASTLVSNNVQFDTIERISGLKPIHFAAKNGNTEIVKFLLDKGVDINSLSTDSRTPLFYAGYGEHKSTWQFLLDQNARIAAKNDLNFYSTAQLHRKFGEYLSKNNKAKRTAECYAIASDNFKEASTQFKKISDDIKNKRWWLKVKELLGNAVLAYDASLEAKYQAKSMAEISPSGKGKAAVFYKQYDFNTKSMQEVEQDLAKLAAECNENSIECKRLADHYDTK